MAPDSSCQHERRRRDHRQRPPLPPAAASPPSSSASTAASPTTSSAAVAAGRAPWLERGADARARACSADCVVPSFTNPNNLSIVTGAPPSVHGICGNYFFDPDSGQRGDDERPEVPARADAPRRACQHAGAASPSITAKDKLRRLLARARAGMARHLLLGREGRPGERGRERHRRRARAGRHAGARRLQRRAVGVRVRRRRRS